MAAQELTTLIEEMLRPVRDQLEVLMKARDESLEAQMMARKNFIEERRRTDEAELKSMEDKTWTPTFISKKNSALQSATWLCKATVMLYAFPTLPT